MVVRTMNKLIMTAAVIVGLGGGVAVGWKQMRDRGGQTACAGKGARTAVSDQRLRIPLSDQHPFRGGSSETAKVTIVAFSDFECPFCSKVVPTIEQVLKTYGNRVRIQFRHNPLPFHEHARDAARAAVFAAERGKFWEMHDKMFGRQQRLAPEDLLKYAGELGLDAAALKQSLEQKRADKQIDEDTALAAAKGANSTPTFFVNGRAIKGALPFETFREVIDQEIVVADKLAEKGIGTAQVYATLMDAAKEAPDPTVEVEEAVAPKRFKIPADGKLAHGDANAKVTILEFSDFECPFCAKGSESIGRLSEEFGKDLRVVFKHSPLPDHAHARLAAIAASAAAEQGRFWEMRNLLFKNQSALTRPDLERHAQTIGLDLARFNADLDSPRYEEQLKADRALAVQFGLEGTPTFFINGRVLTGAKPYEDLKKIVESEIAAADALLAAGTARNALYAALTRDGLTKAEEQPVVPEPPDTKLVYKIEVGDAPMRGNADAKVTIVMWSDFQCPFCARAEGTLEQVRKTYGNAVRIVWKDMPLPFHDDARPAATVARVAAAQGKFWQMHDLLFDHQNALTRPDLEKYAQTVGLDLAKVKAALDKDTAKAQIQAHVDQAQRLGVTGTPAFFVNGRFLSGAQPFDRFKSLIDEEVTKADALLARGVKPAQLYAELVKEGLTKQDPAQAAARPVGMPTTRDIYRVEVGKSPVRGRPDAKVTIVEWADYECPLSREMEVTLAELRKKYGADLRIVWKDLPNNGFAHSKTASLLARWAQQENKFWEMHDKLFANQDALSRPALDTYAQELSLDPVQARVAMDTKLLMPLIRADRAQAETFKVRGTPIFFINGRFVLGKQPIQAFEKIIDAELKRANGLLAKGVKRTRLYEELIKSGKTEVASAPVLPNAVDPSQVARR
jgi:protein-disulfide isomerase